MGEIVDEYDTEEAEVERISESEAIVDARLAIDDLNELFAIEVENEDFDTVGGLVFSLLGRLAAPGDRVESEQHGLELQVLSVSGRRIRRVRITQRPPVDEAVGRLLGINARRSDCDGGDECCHERCRRCQSYSLHV